MAMAEEGRHLRRARPVRVPQTVDVDEALSLAGTGHFDADRAVAHPWAMPQLSRQAEGVQKLVVLLAPVCDPPSIEPWGD